MSAAVVAPAMRTSDTVLHEVSTYEEGDVVMTGKTETVKREDIRIAMIGNVDSGKSTLVGCLTRDKLDDGRGDARASVFRHRHERENGRTSSVGVELMGFDESAQVVVDQKLSRQNQWKEIARRSNRSVTLIDLCGHEKYLKTTVFGLTGMLPDYGLVVVGANMGVSMMTKEHIGIAAALRLPMLVVVTKIDIAPEKVYKATMKSVQRALRAAGRKAFSVRSESDLVTAASAMTGNRITPVICLSNVTGEGLPFLRTLLQTLPVRSHKAKVTGKTKKSKKVADEAKATDSESKGLAEEDGKKAKKQEDKSELLIDSVFQVPGVGCVVAGMVTQGEFHAGGSYLLGPDSTGHFQPVVVRSIHVHYTPIDSATSGRSAALAIRAKGKVKSGSSKKRTWVRKGMTLVSADKVGNACWEFEADVAVLHHQTTLSVGYAPTMHCGVVSQTAKIVSIHDKKGVSLPHLRTGDRAIVRCRWMYRPEYVQEGTILLFREGRAKGVGRVKKVFPSGVADGKDGKPAKTKKDT